MSAYDVFTRVSNNQSLIGAGTLGGGLSLSTSSIDLLSSGTTPRILGRDIGPGSEIAFRVHITQTFDAGAGNLAISVAFSTTEDLLGSPSFIACLTIPSTSLVLGREFDVSVPQPMLALIGGSPVRYIGLLYAVGGGVAATGAVSAWVPLGHTAGLPQRYLGNYAGP